MGDTAETFTGKQPLEGESGHILAWSTVLK